MCFEDLTELHFIYKKNGGNYRATIRSEALTGDRIYIYPNQHAIVFNVDQVMISTEDAESVDGWAEGKIYHYDDITFFVRD